MLSLAYHYHPSRPTYSRSNHCTTRVPNRKHLTSRKLPAPIDQLRQKCLSSILFVPAHPHFTDHHLRNIDHRQVLIAILFIVIQDNTPFGTQRQSTTVQYHYTINISLVFWLPVYCRVQSIPIVMIQPIVTPQPKQP